MEFALNVAIFMGSIRFLKAVLIKWYLIKQVKQDGFMIINQRLAQLLATTAITGILTGCNPIPPPVGVVATPLEIRASIRNSEEPLTLVHVWATWCDPCREEFPELMKVYREAHQRGLSLQLVSADDPADVETVNQFLREQQSPVNSLVSTELSGEFIELFSTNWSGSLPASFFFDANGKLVAEWAGKRSYDEYMQTIEQLLKP
jgi:thiol-disulfide isomerase/thioredoxin